MVDLPTPPFPDATQITFLTCANAPSGSLRTTELLLQAGLLALGEDIEADLDRVDALELGDVLYDRLLEVRADRTARVVSETTTSTRPSSRISIERTMPSSTMERRSSGSITRASFSFTGPWSARQTL